MRAKDKAEIEALVTETVKHELAKLLHGVAMVPVERVGRGGKARTVKKTFSIPTEVWKEVEKLGGIRSSHVTAALRLYLKLGQRRNGS